MLHRTSVGDISRRPSGTPLRLQSFAALVSDVLENENAGLGNPARGPEKMSYATRADPFLMLRSCESESVRQAP